MRVVPLVDSGPAQQRQRRPDERDAFDGTGVEELAVVELQRKVFHLGAGQLTGLGGRGDDGPTIEPADVPDTRCAA